MLVARRLALVVALALAPGCALLGGKDRAMEELALQGASTSSEHQALADYYHRKAESARSQIEYHRRMAKSYRARRRPRFLTRTQMETHCERIESALESLSTEYDDLAHLHGQEATDATPSESPTTP